MEEAWGVGGLDEGEMHTRIDWSCRALGSAFLGSPSQSPFFPQRATDAGTASRVRNFVMFLLIVRWKLSLPSVALHEPEEEGSVHWPEVGDGGLRTQSSHLDS